MIFIWFIYGLAFFTLGLVVIIYPKKGSAFRLADHIWLIAGFGILHGINEWLDMFIVLGEPFPAKILKLIRVAILSGSFLFLLRFGTEVVAEGRKEYRPLRALPIILFIPWAIIFATSRQHLLIGDIWARYLFCVPGAFLTALGLFLQIPQLKETKLRGAIRNLRLAGIAFLFYTVFAGLIVKKATFFPASYFNYDAFRHTFAVPVQVFRTLCAVVLAYSTARLLSIFRWETEEALRRSEQRCSTIASTMPMILLVQDRDSVITFIQGKGLDPLGLKAPEIIGKRISEVFPSVPQLDEDSRRALSGEEFITHVRIDGIVFESCYSPLRDNEGEVVGVIGVAFDVTVRVKVQEQLDRYRREIEKNARLAEIGAMSSIMAQQLDEPLTVTRLLLQRLAGELGTASTPEEVIGSVRKGLAEVSKAADIVERFRSVAQVPGTSIIAPLDVYQVGRRVATVFAQSAKDANLNIALKNMDFVPVMSLNSRELEQIFFIMIQNAIDAADTNKRQSLNISCRATAKEIELQFADTCGGIEPEKLQHIFEPFRAKEPGVKDTGLSLAIAKQIICAHGGEIVAESKPGRGTTFYVRVPVEHVH